MRGKGRKRETKGARRDKEVLNAPTLCIIFTHNARTSVVASRGVGV